MESLLTATISPKPTSVEGANGINSQTIGKKDQACVCKVHGFVCVCAHKLGGLGQLFQTATIVNLRLRNGQNFTYNSASHRTLGGQLQADRRFRVSHEQAITDNNGVVPSFSVKHRQFLQDLQLFRLGFKQHKFPFLAGNQYRTRILQ
jgi:hypothetical protein